MMTRTMILNEFVSKVTSKGFTCHLNPDVVYNVDTSVDLPLLIIEASRDAFLADAIWEDIKDVFQGQQRLTDGFAISNEVESTFEYDSDISLCVYRTTFDVQYNTEL